MKRVVKYIVFAIIAILFVSTFVMLFKKSQPKVDVYEQIEAVKGNISRTTIVTGTIQPRNEVNIKPQINGIISELYKEAGEQVKQGEVIAKLKVIPDMSSLSAAQSRVRLAEINLKQAQTDYNREKALYDKEMVSAQEYDQVYQLLKQAQEEKNAAQDALEVIRDGVSSANATSSSTLVRSTISGLILDIPVKEGNSVIQANTMNDGTTVATVADMSDLIFDGKIDETEVGALSEGIPVKITIGALQGYSLDAVLEYISPKAELENGANLFEIKAAIAVDGDKFIRSGYSANAEIILKHVDDVVIVPESTLEFDGDDSYVYVSKGEQEYEKVKVETGLSDGINIEIKSGIKEGDMIRGNKTVAPIKQK